MLQTWAPSFVLLFCFFDMYLVNVHALLKNMLMFRNLTQRSLLLSYGEILHFTLFCAYLMSHPSHPPWFDGSFNILWRAEIMKLLIMLFSPSSCYVLLLRSIYFPQFFLKHFPSVFFPWG
jgi:hypothetical protein